MWFFSSFNFIQMISFYLLILNVSIYLVAMVSQFIVFALFRRRKVCNMSVYGEYFSILIGVFYRTTIDMQALQSLPAMIPLGWMFCLSFTKSLMIEANFLVSLRNWNIIAVFAFYAEH
ncbi:hypothetical protein ABFS82_13G160200 [Erythranthe guttata]